VALVICNLIEPSIKHKVDQRQSKPPRQQPQCLPDSLAQAASLWMC
jgi:hypothetical protein